MRFHDNTASGGRKVIYDYANWLANNNHQVEIVFLADIPFELRKFNLIKHEVHFAKFIKRRREQLLISWFDLHPNIQLKAKYSFKSSEYKERDIVVACDYGIALHIAEAKYNLKKVVYFIQHDEKVYNDIKIVRDAWRLPVQKIVVATWLYNLVSQVDYRVSIVKNYVRTETFYVNNPIKNRTHTVSLINHPSRYKGVDTGLEALHLVHDMYADLNVIFFGNPTAPHDMPSYVHYIQRADEQKLRDEIYNQSSIFLFPSVLEGWGLVATEAMACGAALVSTRNGGVEDFGLDGKTALLSDVGDYRGLADSIISLFRDNDRRVMLANEGKELVEQLTFKSSANKFEDVLIKIAKKDNVNG